MLTACRKNVNVNLIKQTVKGDPATNNMTVHRWKMCKRVSSLNEDISTVGLEQKVWCCMSSHDLGYIKALRNN